MGNSSDGTSEPQHAMHTGLLQGRSVMPAQIVMAGIHAITALRVPIDLVWHYLLLLLDFLTMVVFFLSNRYSLII